jgi:hypothetical protein
MKFSIEYEKITKFIHINAVNFLGTPHIQVKIISKEWSLSQNNENETYIMELIGRAGLP